MERFFHTLYVAGISCKKIRINIIDVNVTIFSTDRMFLRRRSQDATQCDNQSKQEKKEWQMFFQACVCYDLRIAFCVLCRWAIISGP